jgi:hypothetical protein
MSDLHVSNNNNTNSNSNNNSNNNNNNNNNYKTTSTDGISLKIDNKIKRKLTIDATKVLSRLLHKKSGPE